MGPHLEFPSSETAKAKYHKRFEKGAPDECWHWNGCVTAHNQLIINMDGKLYNARRLAVYYAGRIEQGNSSICITASCDNQMCVNPNHLRLETRGQMQNRLKAEGRTTKGSKHKMSKLTEADIIEMRKLYIKQHSRFGYAGLAKQFGVTPGCVRDILIGKTWTHV